MSCSNALRLTIPVVYNFTGKQQRYQTVLEKVIDLKHMGLPGHYRITDEALLAETT